MNQMIVISLSLLLSPLAMAQDPVDLGVLKDSEIQVVQRRLYALEDSSEVTAAAGVLPFDPYTIAPKVQLSYTRHKSESMAYEVQVGAGYGLKNATYRTLDSPAYGKVPEAYRYLGGLTAGLLWSPIYAKMNYQGNRIFHHNVYAPAVVGVTVEQTVDPNLVADSLDRYAIAPTLGAGLGIRIFLHDGGALRVELRDDLMLQKRSGSDTWALKQNANVHVGYSMLMAAQ